MLHWDINAKDDRFPKIRFRTLERIPLYYCWSCVNDLAYQVTSQSTIRIVSRKFKADKPNFQYEPYPSVFKRTPLALDSVVPRYHSNDLQDVGFGKRPFLRKPTPKRCALLESFFQHPFSIPAFGQISFTIRWCAIRQRWWNEESTRCPHKKCPGRTKIGGRKMSFLAGIANDPLRGLPMVEPALKNDATYWNYMVSVKFEICGDCLTIHGSNRCD